MGYDITFKSSARSAAVSSGDSLSNNAYSSLTTFHVNSITGNDTNPGSELSPWKTPAKAFATLTAGQRALYRGDFSGSTALGTSGNLHSANTGTSSAAPIVHMGHPDYSMPTFVLGNDQMIYTNENNVAKYVILRKLDVSQDPAANFSAGGNWGLVRWIYDNDCTGSGIEFCHLHNSNANGGGANTAGVSAFADWPGLYVKQTKIHDIAYSGAFTNKNSCGVQSYRSPGIAIDNCEIYNAYSLLFMKQCYYGNPTTASFSVPSTMRAHKNKLHNGGTAYNLSEAGGADLKHHEGAEFTGNLVYTCDTAHFTEAWENTEQNTDLLIEYNTIGHDVPWGILINAFTNVRARKNVILASQYLLGTYNHGGSDTYARQYSEVNNNRYYQGGGQWATNVDSGVTNYGTLSAWQGSYPGSHLTATPDVNSAVITSLASNFVDATNHDYTRIGSLAGFDGGHQSDCGPNW
jgi:hypothetical protein